MEVYVADVKAVEAARVAVVKAVEGSESAYGRWTKVAVAVKAAWPTAALCDKAALGEWIIAGLSKPEQGMLAEGYVEAAKAKVEAAEAAVEAAKASDDDDVRCTAADNLTKAMHDLEEAKADRKAAQDKVSQYKKRAIEAAYPAPVVKPIEPTLTPDQVEAKAVAEAAKAAQMEWVQSATVLGEVKAEAAVKAAEVKVTETKAKAAEAKAKIDPTKAAEAEALRAQAETEKAEAAVIKAQAAELEEANKIKAETAKALQKSADEKNAAIKLAAKIAKVIEEAEALLVKAGALEGAEGLVNYMTATRNALIEFKAANI
jgi:cell envelope opacity-associated protein A